MGLTGPGSPHTLPTAQDPISAPLGLLVRAQAMSLQGWSLAPYGPAQSIHGPPASHSPLHGHPKIVFPVWLPSMSPIG